MQVVDFEGEILGVMLPEKLVLEVRECPPGVKGNTATNATKEAVLETGFRLQVPLFIEEGEKLLLIPSKENIIPELKKRGSLFFLVISFFLRYDFTEVILCCFVLISATPTLF